MEFLIIIVAAIAIYIISLNVRKDTSVADLHYYNYLGTLNSHTGSKDIYGADFKIGIQEKTITIYRNGQFFTQIAIKERTADPEVGLKSYVGTNSGGSVFVLLNVAQQTFTIMTVSGRLYVFAIDKAMIDSSFDAFEKGKSDWREKQRQESLHNDYNHW